MNKGDKLQKLMNRDERLSQRFQCAWWLWYRTDNRHPDKSRLYNRVMKIDALCNQNTKQITDLINGPEGE